MTAFVKLFSFACWLLLSGCVLQSDYDKLKAENAALATQLEEEQFGAGKLLREANDFFAADNMTQAEAKVNLLLSKHPAKPEAIEAAALKSRIEERKTVLAEEGLWSRAQQSEEVSLVQQYLDNYPAGKYRAGAQQRLAALKVKKREDEYQQALSANRADLWKQFLENYPDHPDREAIRQKIIQAEVEDIFRGEHGQLPSFTSTGWGSAEVSTVSITNDTGYELAIRYVGPDTKMMEIPSGATRSISLSSGSYRIAASVNAANVSNYAGTENLNGSYDSRFYIRQSFY